MSDLRETEHARMIREQEEAGEMKTCPTCDGEGGWLEAGEGV